ncbi:MAG: ribonuclease III [Candidatus Eremiobacteraeota bacterium]|nr:ribonuclease III [Candidatus Eremiobacteraeota bacterium]
MPGEARRRRLRALLKRADVDPNAFELVEEAFIHESAARASDGMSNERLEFLGDAILGFIVSRWLYERYTQDREGQLTRRKAAIVNDRVLAESAHRLRFEELIRLDASARAAGVAEQVSILGSTFEAFIAALCLRFGLDVAQRFVEQEHLAYVDPAALEDPKTVLQEFTQLHYACTPNYREDAAGPPHARRFTSFVSIKGKLLGTGVGHSKRAAQQEAAAAALRRVLI